MTQALLAPTDLTAMDRCDRCGAQAFFRAVLINGELLFCAHHGREYGEKLSLSAILIEDRSGEINPKSAPAH